MQSNIYLFKKSEFARAAGIAPATATKLFKPGHMLAAALVNGAVDMSHPDVQEYLAKRAEVPQGASVRGKVKGGYAKNNIKNFVGGENQAATPADRVVRADAPTPEPGIPKATEPPTASVAPKATPEPTVPAAISYDLQDYEHLTVREVAMQFGNIDAFKRFVESAKQIADYKLKEISIEKQRGELVDRDQVRRTVFSLIDVAFSRIVSDVPGLLAAQVLEIFEEGGDNPLRDIEAAIRDANSQAIQACKDSVTKAKVLKNANSRHSR